MGREVIFFEDGPPNAGRPFIRKPEDIKQLKPPKIRESACLAKVLKAAHTWGRYPLDWVKDYGE